MKSIDKITFTSPINIDNGFTNIPQGEHESTMELFGDEIGRYRIEWMIEALNTVEYIGVFCYDADKVVSDYDGVFELPEQAIQLLEKNGFNCEEVK